MKWGPDAFTKSIDPCQPALEMELKLKTKKENIW